MRTFARLKGQKLDQEINIAFFYIEILTCQGRAEQFQTLYPVLLAEANQFLPLVFNQLDHLYYS